MEQINYEVWALGYDKDYLCTDVEIIMGTFTKPEQAIMFAKCFETKQDVVNNYSDQIEKFGNLAEGDSFKIRVEKVDISNSKHTECIDTLYTKEIK